MIVSKSPYRISLGGGGTDLESYYSKHGGFILSAAINKYMNICLMENPLDKEIRVRYSKSEQVTSIDDLQHDLVKWSLRDFDLRNRGLEITSIGEIPAGTGLGSSGTFLVSLVRAFAELQGYGSTKQHIAERAYYIEKELAGHPVGKHDHYLAAFGGITCLEIDTSGEVVVSPLNMQPHIIEAFRDHVALFYTGKTRNNGDDILREQDFKSKSDNSEMIQSLHEIKEIGYEIKTALTVGDLDKFGLLLDKHWQAKKRRSVDISNNRIDEWYKIAKSNGALGGKIMGAGGGGFFMFYCPTMKVKHGIRDAFRNQPLVEMPFDFDFSGSQVFTV